MTWSTGDTVARALATTLKTALKKALDEHFVLTLAIAGVIIISSMIVVFLVTSKPERYTQIGLLNESGEIGPFPANVTYNGTLNVMFTVSNHEGTVEWYKVKVFLGDQASTINPKNGTTGGLLMGSYERVVGIEGDEGGWMQDVAITFNETLVGLKKVIFELWQYDAELSTFFFTNQTVHVWIDILAP